MKLKVIFYLKLVIFIIGILIPIYLLKTWPFNNMRLFVSAEEVTLRYFGIGIMIFFVLICGIKYILKDFSNPLISKVLNRLDNFNIARKKLKIFTKIFFYSSGGIYLVLVSFYLYKNYRHQQKLNQIKAFITSNSSDENLCLPKILQFGTPLVSPKFEALKKYTNTKYEYRSSTLDMRFFNFSGTLSSLLEYDENAYIEYVGKYKSLNLFTFELREHAYPFHLHMLAYDFIKIAEYDLLLTNTKDSYNMIEACKKEAEQGNKDSIFALASYYYHLVGYQKLLNLLETNDPKFFDKLYHFQINDEKHKDQLNKNLIKYLNLAAKNGHQQSQILLGIIYLNGINVIKNETLALKNFIVAAKQGNSYAQYEAGLLFLKDRSTKDVGLELLEVSANQGNCLAANELYKYFRGEYLSANALKKMYFWQLISHYLYEKGRPSSIVLDEKIKFFEISDYYEKKTCYSPKSHANLDIKSQRDIQNMASLWQNLFETNKENYEQYEQVTKDEKPVIQPKISIKWVPIKSDICNSKPSSIARTSSEIYKGILPSIWKVQVYKTKEHLKKQTPFAQGSSVAISATQLLTNCHVVQDSETIEILQKEKVVSVKTVSADPKNDMCILELKNGTFDNFINTAKSFSQLEIGTKVYTLGTPRGLDMTFADGIVSGLRTENIPLIQTTAPISPGSSGGALVDEYGNLLGITTFYIKDGQNLNFAIPIHNFCQK